MGKATRRKAERRAQRLERVAAAATSMPELHPNVTSVAGVLNETSVSTWMGGMGGTTPDPMDEDDAPYAASNSALIDKHFLHGGLHMPVGIALAAMVLAGVILVGWLFVQDNGAGRLENPDGFQHFLVKASYAAALVIVGVVLLLAVGLGASVFRWLAARYPWIGGLRG